MLKTLALALTIGAASMLFAADAGALPISQGLLTAASGDVTLVREGCGRGMRYSNRLRRCVEEGRPIIRPRICGRGFHYSERRGHCVRN